jgi:hypothetical protein
MVDTADSIGRDPKQRATELVINPHLWGRATTAKWGSVNLLQIKLFSRVCIVKLRPRICYVLSLLRVHSPDCKHCVAHLTCGDELRKRLDELNGRPQACSHENGDHREFVEGPRCQAAAVGARR